MQPAWSWNNTGHKVVAYIAYGRLTPKARAKVDALLKAHPQFEEFSDSNTGVAPMRMAFVNFATWSDDIKGDKRYVDTPRVDENCQPQGSPKPAPGPLFPGFPDMQRHQEWHYDDIPFSPDNTPTHASCAPNAVTQIQAILKDLAAPDVADATKAYELPWLEHLVGDIHQPLHAVSRFSADYTKGDQGGNLVRLRDGSNLHSFWDGLPGIPDSSVVVIEVAAKVRRASSKNVPEASPADWAADSSAVAQKEVYNFTGKGTSDDPVRLSDNYKVNARNIAYARLGQAAQRLADVLNETLGK
jgi:hypothetical protein